MNIGFILRNVFSFLALPFVVTVVIPYVVREQLNPIYRIPPANSLFLTGVFIIIMGLILFFWTLRDFMVVGQGTLAPWDPPTKFIITGLYRYWRNPMISGVLLILIGEACLFHSLNIFIWAILFFIINSVYLRRYEEVDLEKRFGADYIHYKEHTARWLPRIKPYQRN